MIKKGRIKSKAKLKRKNAKLITGNSCKVTLATAKLTPQMEWAASRANTGKITALEIFTTSSVTIMTGALQPIDPKLEFLEFGFLDLSKQPDFFQLLQVQ